MGTMRYKPSDKVRIKSIDWYNENKDQHGRVACGYHVFTEDMSKFCGQTMIICNRTNIGVMTMGDSASYWTDEMIEGLVEEETKPNIIEEAKTYWDSIKDAWICPDGYQFKDENGNVINATKILLEKKKKEYPKTYEECAEIIAEFTGSDCNPKGCMGYYAYELEHLQKLLICRDAYWKIAGADMGLDGPWKPIDNSEVCYGIFTWAGEIQHNTTAKWRILTFPTEEMRDAFYENFDPDIEICKELL